ncbi:MAG: translocation/assembly module TamB domain-containing protein [Bacteroidota bacterium]
MATLAGFSQTRAFKAWLLDRVVSAADASLNGNLRIGRIEGNLITGLELYDVRLVERGVTLVAAERVDVSYDPLGVALQRIGISDVTVVRPEILLYRSLDSTWNINRLAKPTEQDSAISSWTIVVRQARLNDARVRIIDSVALRGRERRGTVLPDSAVDYANVLLEDVQLSGGAEIGSQALSVRIDALEGMLRHPDIRIKSLAALFRMTRNVVSVEGLKIETDRTRISGDASLGADLAHLSRLSDLERAPVLVDFRANPLDLRELRQFLYPAVEFLDQEVSLNITGRGTFGNLSVDRLSLQTPRSFIQLRGQIVNLHRPQDLTLDLEGGESLANSDDIRSLLPGISIPDWRRFGDVRFFASFKGRPASEFDAHVFALSERGTVDARASLTLGSLFTYKGSARLKDFDLGGFIGDGTEMTALSGVVTFDGSDTDLRRIIGVVRADLDSSDVSGVALGRTVAVLNAAEGTYGLTVSSQAPLGRLRGSGRLMLQRSGGYHYVLGATLDAFDLSELVRHPEYESDLNLSITAGGLETPDGHRTDSVAVGVEPSRFAGSTLGRSSITASYRVLDGDLQEFEFDSDPISMTVDGVFTPASLAGVLSHAGSSIGRYFVSTFGSLDSLRAFTPGVFAVAAPLTHLHGLDSVDVRIALDIRDLVAVGRLARADLRGDAVAVLEAQGRVADPTLRLDLLGRNVAYSDSVVQLTAEDVAASIRSRGLVDSTIGRSIEIDADVAAGTLTVNGRRFDDADVAVRLAADSGTIAARAFMDSTLRFHAAGRTAFRDRLLEVTLDTVTLDVHSYTVDAVEPARIAVGRDGFLFRHLQLATEGQEFSAAGYFSPAGVSDLSIGFSNFLAGDLRSILRRSSYAELVRDIGGIVNGTLLFRGTLDHPNLRLELGADGVRLEETVFGRFDVRMSYFEQALDLFVRLQSRTEDARSRPDLLLSGRVPYVLTLKGVAPETPPDGAIDLEMTTQGLDLRFLEPFLVDVTRAMRGTLTCDLRMRGTVAAPLYEGSASIRNARFLFMPTRFEYLLDGDLRPEGDQIKLQNVMIRNTPEDFADGRMNASGALTLQGITLKGFDLGFAGQLQVMREDSSRLLGQKFYGDLTAETGPQGLRWQGNPQRSLLSGTVLVRNAQITLPPDRESPRYSVRVIDVIRADDSLQARARLALTPEDATEPGTAPATQPAPRSFVDGIGFDLVLETQGPTQVRFVFNRQTNDILFADLRGRMGFQRTLTSTRLTGEVEVTNRSYYNFLKRFAATGKILFTGDPLNPELDIVARYEGVHQAMQGAGLPGNGTDIGTSPQPRDENVAVILYLRGPRSKLETRFEVEVQRADGSKELRKGDVEADAIAFIMSNQFRDELTEQQRSAQLGVDLGYGLASGLVTGPLSETLRRTTEGSIQSLDVIYYGGGQFASGTDIRVTGQLGDAIYRIGGRVFDGIDKSNIVVEVPMSWVVNSPKLRNLILTLERRADGISSLDYQRRASNGAKVLYRFTF